MTLTEFLLARIAEDEAVVRDATKHLGPRWYANGGEVRTLPHDDPRSIEPCWTQVVKLGTEHGPHGRPGGWGSGWWERVDAVALIARFDPARVLAECEAKRRIVDLHQMTEAEACWVCAEMGSHSGSPEDWPCRTLLALAQPYADHPDFDPAWRLTESAEPSDDRPGATEWEQPDFECKHPDGVVSQAISGKRREFCPTCNTWLS